MTIRVFIKFEGSENFLHHEIEYFFNNTFGLMALREG